MLYKSPSDWNTSQSKSIMLFGMSGLGKNIYFRTSAKQW